MNSANFAFTHMFSFPETPFCLPTSTFQIPLLTIDFYCLSLPENQVSSLALNFKKVVNLWFQNSKAFQNQAGDLKVKQAVLPSANWRRQHLQRHGMVNIYLTTWFFWNVVHPSLPISQCLLSMMTSGCQKKVHYYAPQGYKILERCWTDSSNIIKLLCQMAILWRPLWLYFVGYSLCKYGFTPNSLIFFFCLSIGCFLLGVA